MSFQQNTVEYVIYQCVHYTHYFFDVMQDKKSENNTIYFDDMRPYISNV